MTESEEIQKLIDELSFRKSDIKNFENMKAEEISKELREIMKFEQESLKKIEEFEKTQKNSDLIQYAKMISKNTMGREIATLQEIYLKILIKNILIQNKFIFHLRITSIEHIQF